MVPRAAKPRLKESGDSADAHESQEIDLPMPLSGGIFLRHLRLFAAKPPVSETPELQFKNCARQNVILRDCVTESELRAHRD